MTIDAYKSLEQIVQDINHGTERDPVELAADYVAYAAKANMEDSTDFTKDYTLEDYLQEHETYSIHIQALISSGADIDPVIVFECARKRLYALVWPRCESLQELTGKESGIVVYNEREAIVCNWTGFQGLPRLFATGVIGWPHTFERTDPIPCDDIPALMEGVDILYANGEDMPQTGSVYEIDDISGNTGLVICPDGWH